MGGGGGGCLKIIVNSKNFGILTVTVSKILVF